MDLIRDVADWFATGWGDRLGIFFPLVLLGVLGLYVLWLVIGYVRVSQVGINDRPADQSVVALPSTGGGEAVDHPRGIPYCHFDQLAFPAGARFCTGCERDLSLDCVNCGATLSASSASCYRCGTRTGVADTALLG
ncbi:MAG: zinc ribbon domain-containing protein [Chloroflexota bacterium]|nr:zinc ribbon domain-containing protein [Chloroflexota bacterium]